MEAEADLIDKPEFPSPPSSSHFHFFSLISLILIAFVSSSSSSLGLHSTLQSWEPKIPLSFQLPWSSRWSTFDLQIVKFTDINVDSHSGGLEILFANERKHNVALPAQSGNGCKPNIAYLLQYLVENLMKDERKELFILEDNVYASWHV